MFKKIFLLAIVSGLMASLVSIVYVSGYKTLVDFSEIASYVNIFSYNFLFAMIACFLFFGISSVLKNKSIATFLFNAILSMLSIGLVFYVLKTEDPTFKNEDAELMKDFFKGFLMPMLFFPALSWFTFKPLFIK
jgi:hypothetical protein